MGKAHQFSRFTPKYSTQSFPFKIHKIVYGYLICIFINIGVNNVEQIRGHRCFNFSMWNFHPLVLSYWYFHVEKKNNRIFLLSIYNF